MSTANDEAEAGETSAGTATYCLKRSLKLSTIRLRVSRRRDELRDIILGR
jgi:hypothetical protein